MTKQIQFRRGSSAEHQAFTGASGEITVDTNLDVAVVHDGSTPGGQYLIGETSPQGLTNKRWVGIGTTTTGSLQFVAIGDANIDGNLQLRSLDINFRDPVTLSGIRSDTSNNIITGINTSDIRVGYVVTSNVVSSGTTVISVGTNFIQLSDYTPETQIQKIGTLNNTDGNVLGIDTSNIAVGYAISNYSILLSGALVTEVGVGSITVSETVIGPQGSTEPFYFSNLSISTSLTFNDPLTGILNVGIITAGYVTLEDLTVNGPAYITGISTFSDRVIFDSTNSIQIPYGTTAERDVVGVAVTGQIRFNTDNSSFEGYGSGGEWGSLGGVKDVDGDTYIIPESSPGSDEDTLYIYAGGAVAGTISSTIGTILNVDLQVSGITTISGFLDVQEYANIGQNISVGTTVQTDDIVATGEIYVGADIFTYGINAEIGITTYLNSTDFEATRESVGLSTIVDAFITNSYSENGYINVGIVTTISGTDLNYTTADIDTAYVTTGVVTTISGSDLTYATSRSGNSYINVGFVTTLYVNTGVVTTISGTDLTYTNATINNVYADVGIVTTISGTNVSYSGIGTIETLDTTTGTIDYLSNTNLNTSGIGTIATLDTTTGTIDYLSGTDLTYATSRSGNSYINVGFVTTLYVNTGVVTTISGTDLTYTTADIDTAYVTTGVVTSISGTDLNYSGVGTITNLEVTTGTVTNLTSTDSTITTADIDTAYVTTGVVTTISGSDLTYTTADIDTAYVTTGVVTTISGTDLTYTTADIDTAYVTTGVVTTISGTDLNYSGISTLNKVGVTTLTFDAYNNTLSQDSSVTIKTSTSGISSHYTLTLPATVGTAGQVLGILPGGNGELGFTTAGLYESRYYVSALNGNDSYDGKTLPVKTIKKAAQLASFSSFVIPGQRYLDAGNLLESNKEFIKEEVVAYLEFNYENITTDLPDYDATICKRDVGYLVDALVYDIRFGGNSKSIEAGNAYWDGATSYVAGEEEQAIFAYEYLKFIGQYVINNQTPPTIYQTSVSQSFDFTITQDPNNTNDFDFHVSKDARNLILANKLEIVDKSLAAIAIDHPDFYFPGDTQSNERSRFYDSYRLIQQNKQEIIDYAWADTVATYPGVSSTEDKCKRDLGYFIDAVSTDVFTGGNNYTRSFLGFYFDGGAPLGNGLVGEEIESNHAFTEAAVGMSSALTNQLTIQDLTITSDPITGSNTDPLSCANVRSTVSTLTGIVTTAVAAGSTAGIGTTSNYGYFLITPDLNVSDSVGIGSTNIFGGRKCARDLNYIVDALAQDVSFDTNQHILYATKKYFDGAGTLISNGVAGETSESITAFNATRDLAKKAITNQLNNRDLTVIADSVTGFNTDPYSCSSTQTQIGNLVGILTTALDTASLVGIASTSIGQTDCADVRSALVNYVGIITTIVGLGTTAAPATVLPETQSKPIAIFVEAGEYVEDNPIILYDDIAVLGDNLRNTIIRPQNANKDLFRLRNGVYLTGFAMKDAIDAAGVPQYTFNYAVAFDDPADTTTSRIGYATKSDPPVIFRSPYIQNCSILSFLGGNGILVDGSKVQSPNVALVPQESERPVVGDQPQQGKSMVAAAFTMVSFGGIGWRTINDGYAQVVSCFQIFCKYGSLTQSGGYLSITNSATNFGLYALRSTGFSKNSFAFDRGRIAATGTSGGSQTLKVVGLGRSEQDLYVCRFINNSGNDQTALFKPVPVTQTFTGTASTVGGSVGIASDKLFITGHPFLNGDSVVYYGDVQDVPERVIGGLIHENQYYVVYIDANTIQLTEDSSLTQIVDLTGASTGIHTFIKNTQEFFASEIVDRHNSYQKITIPGTQTLEFVSGRQVQQTVTTGTAVGYAYTWDSSSRELIVSVELSNDERINFAVTDGVTNLLIEDHTGTPIGTSIGAVTGLTTYWSVNAKIASTLAGGTIITPSNLPEDYKLHFHRPSVINSSSHTWEYSGSGTDYNALPENGGRTDPATEQVSEGGGRVYSSGTNELGDFKIGDFITAYNRTGNIIFNNTVTIGNLDSLRLSLSGGVSIEEFSIDGGMGDNETGGPQNSRVSTQLAVRTFLSNRLGNFIDKLVSTNSIPNAVVQLNSLGQINADLIPPKSVNYYKANYEGARTQLVNQIPAQNILSGEVVSEPVDSFVLLSDLLSQYIVLDNDTIYNFNNQDEIVSVNAGGGAIGVVTAPTTSGVNTDTLSFPNVGYGTTGLVRGVSLSLKDLVGGSGYTSAGIYTGVRLDISSGIGTGITGTITVGVSGTVTNVAITTGGFKFEVDDLLTVNDPNEIGGRSGGSNFTVKIGSVETRLYIGLTNAQKFAGTIALPDYFADGNAVGYSTNIGIGTTVAFTPTDIDLSGSVDFANDRIVLGSGHPFADGDAVVYTVTAGTVISPLTNGVTYYTKTVGISSVELYTTYALVTKVDLQSSGTGTHEFVRAGFNTVTDQITFVGHPFTQGDPVRVTGSTPTGITTGNFYFVGSVTTNTFTLHETRAQSLSSINGLLLNTQSLENASGSVGIMTLTEQNVEYTTTVNTSSSDVDNWSLLSSSSLDAANIVSGIFDPIRLGTGVANEQTFLAGDSSYKKVITSVGIGTTAGFDVQGYTSVDFPPGGVGITTYYGDFVLGLNRVESTIDDYSTLGISQYKLTTFAVGEDGRITIKNSASGGDVDAASLGGNSGAYYIDSANHIGIIPITRGGTGLNALPSTGAILQGNGSSYNLTTTPTFVGDVSFNAGAGAITVGTDSDIRFTNGSNWTGEHDSKIQFFNNNLYLQYTTALILRNSAGSNRVTFDSLGNVDVVGIITASRFVSDVAQGTAPFVVASTTQVTNLNANYLNGYASDTANTANRVVRRDASGNFAAGTITATLSGTATNANNINLSDESSDTTCFPVFATSATGNQAPKTGSNLTFNSSTGVLAATTFSGSGASLTNIPNGALTNSTISGVALGSNLNTLTLETSGTGLSGSQTYNGSGVATFTVTSNATSANTGSTIVARNSSGNFSAGTITATLSGTATNATNTTITNDVATNAVHYPTFVSANTGDLGQKVSSTKLTYNPSTGRLTATTLAGSLLNTLTLNTSGTGLSGSTSFNNAGNVTFTVTSNATSANTGGTIVARDGSGNFSAGTITASTYSGNLQYALTRGTYLTGNNFDNSANTTWAVDATSANTASKVVARDGSGNFAGNTISATTFSGNLQYSLTRGSYLTGNNFNNSASTTWAVDATSANTGSKVVARDSSGNFAAGAVTVNSLFSGTVDLTSELNFTSPAAKYIDFYTKNSGGTAYSANLRLVNHDSSSFHTAISMIRDGSVELYYNNSKKLETSNTGVTVSNTVTATTFTSTQATGTAPFTVTSTTKVDNLNADLFDGQDSSYYLNASNFTSIPDGTLTLQTSGTGLSGSTTFSANQETNATFTVVSNATSANTGGAIVARDGSGNFSAGTITATTFSGSGISLTNIPNSATTATTTNTGSTIVSRDSSGNFSAGTITATLSGNATSSTTATNANNINVADESTDTTCFPLFVTAATGNLPPKSGSNLTFNSSTGVLAATTFSGSGASLTNIPNGALTNSTISGVALGSNLNTLTLNTSGTGLSGSATYNGSGTATFTVTSNATSANTASTIVARNSSGNFSAGTITATLSGTATQVSNTLTRGTYLTGSNFDGSSATTWAVDATSANTASKVVARDGSGNFSANTVTLAGELRGPASFVIDPAAVGDNTGTVVIKGNLQIDGTQTTINSTTITIDDLNLTLASGAANAAAANGAGLTIDGASATITYSSTGDSWILNKVPYYNSNRILTTADEGSGNGLDADTLDGLQSTAFAQLSGATFTGNIAFSGSQTVDGRDLSVDGAKLDGIESGATGDQTASEILTLIKTVDGASSDLDADLLDGQQGSYYLNTSTTFGGDVSGTYNAIVVADDSHTHDSRYYTETESNTRYFRRDSSNDVDVRLASGNGRGLRFWDSDSYKIWMSATTDATWGGRLDSTSDYNMYFRMTGGTNRGFVFQNSTTEVFQIESTGQVRTASNNIYANGNLVWHQGNDGSGSGLDADTVDGYQFLSTQGISAVGNFGQWQGHSTYTDFNASISYWGWNYVQANTNAPNSTSAQWYRNRVSLGSEYGLNYSSSHYWLEMAYPRTNNTTAGHMWVRTCENGSVGGWTQVGSNIIGNSSATGTVTASSDIRLKTNIETISDALNKVLDLRGVEFDRPDLDGSPRHIGVIAQEVENVIPEVVFDGADGYKKVAYGNLTAVLIEAVKEQQKQIDELRNEIKKLKGE